MAPVLVPPLWLKATVRPLTGLPAASTACSVRVTSLPAATLPVETATVELLRDGGPGITVTVGSVEVTVSPLIVAAMVVAVPAAWPVKVAV